MGLTLTRMKSVPQLPQEIIDTILEMEMKMDIESSRKKGLGEEMKKEIEMGSGEFWIGWNYATRGWEWFGDELDCQMCGEDCDCVYHEFENAIDNRRDPNYRPRNSPEEWERKYQLYNN